MRSRSNYWAIGFIFVIIFVNCSFFQFLDNPEETSERKVLTGDKNAVWPLTDEPITFNNVSGSVNITGFRADSFAWGDYNNDGYLDFIARGNTTMGTCLFKNNGPPTWNFTDVSNVSNILGNGSSPNRGYPIWGDYNNDNYLDFFIAGDSDMLFQNNGPPNYNFTDVTVTAGNLNDGRPSEAAGWGDYDRDGYIDLYVVSWRDAQNVKYRDVLWHNNGDGTFTDMSTTAGIYTSTTPAYDSQPYAGMGVAWGDYNFDGWPDIYVCNYLITPNYLFRNNHDGTFTDVAMEQGVAGKPDIYQGQGPYYGHTAGAGWADFNNNGDLDLWVSNLAHKDSEQSGGLGRGYFCDDSMIFRNSGAPFFELEDIRNKTGIPITPVGAIQDSSWKDEDYFGVTWGDYDNDCDIDLWVPQVKTYHSWAHSYLWRNNDNETFTDVSDAVGIKVWSNTGAVWGDYNNDGSLDLLTEGTVPYQGKRETRLFESNGNSNNWLQLRLKGVLSNTAALGARVLMTCGGANPVNQTREIGGDAGGHGFQNSFDVEFGLGAYSQADELRIIWPSGRVQVLKNIAANQIINITEDSTGPKITGVSASKYDPYEDEDVTFSGTVAGSPARYQWDYDNDGVIDWESTSTLSNTQFDYDFEGNYTAKLWVWDANSVFGWAETTKFIRVYNDEPIAIAGPKREVWEDEVIKFNASASFDTPSDQDSLIYNWSFDDGTFSGWSSEPEVEHSYPLRGDYDVRLRVLDDDTHLATDVIRVTVNNLPPAAEIICNISTEKDSTMEFTVIGNDTPSDIPYLVYRWDFGDGNDSDWITETTTEHIYRTDGDFVVTCRIRDDDGMPDENYTSVPLTVYNIAPWCVIEEDKIVSEDQVVYFNATAIDSVSDQSLLQYLWDFGDGTSSTWLYQGKQNTTYIYSISGTYQVKLLVTDGSGGECTKILNVTVKNVKPKCEGMENIDVNEDELIKFSCTSSWDTKSDINTLEYSWDIDVTGIPPTPWNSSFDFEYRYVNEGEYTVVLSVRDDDHAIGTASFKVTIRNVEPTARFLVSSKNVEEDETIEFDGTSSTDTSSDIGNLDYTWDFGDNSEKLTGTEPTHRYFEAGSYTVKLTVQDDNSESDTYKETITVRNTAPKAVITTDIKQTYQDTIISFSGKDSTDSASDRANLTFDWDFGDETGTVNGESVEHAFEKTGRYKVTLTVTDDDNSESSDQVDIYIKESSETSEDDTKAVTITAPVNLGLISLIIGLVIILLLSLIFLFRNSRKMARSGEDEHSDKIEAPEPPRQEYMPPVESPKGLMGSQEESSTPKDTEVEMENTDTKPDIKKPKQEALADPTKPKLPPGKKTASGQEEDDLEGSDEPEINNENTSKS